MLQEIADAGANGAIAFPHDYKDLVLWTTFPRELGLRLWKAWAVSASSSGFNKEGHMTAGNDGGREAAADETRSTEDLSRRNLVVNLLGFAAGGLALEALSGCAKGGSAGLGPDIAEIAQNATGTALAWADTVLGTPPPSSGTWTRTGDLATNTSAQLNNAVVVIAMNALTPGTGNYGGGGVFCWDAAGGKDDGGTIIVPNSTGIGANGPCWRRIYSGPLDVRWFGAKGDGVSDDSAAIQNAINAVGYGGVVLFPTPAPSVPPTSYHLGSTITISGRPGIVLEGAKGQPSGTNSSPVLTWGGAADEIMIHLEDPLNVTIRNLEISGATSPGGADAAGYGIYVTSVHGGWGVSNYDNIAISNCTKSPFRFYAATPVDGGRNHFRRCSFRSRHDASGPPEDNACLSYVTSSNVQDVFDHCEFLNVSGAGTRVSGGYGIYVASTDARLQIHNCYTKADTGIAGKGTTVPLLTVVDHYSEDNDFFSTDPANAAHVLRNCSHVVSGGTSISWGGSGTTGYSLVVDGGKYDGAVTVSQVGSPIILANNPDFGGALPTQRIADVIRLGRPGNYSTAGICVVNACGFVPATWTETTANIYPNMGKGDVLFHTLTQNAVVNAPTAIDSTWDTGRGLELHISGDASNAYTVTFNAIFKLAGGAYTHSGAGKLDILTFRYNGTNWFETSRSLDVR